MFKESRTKIGILGGAFDPPTIAHLEIAKEIQSKFVDEVWLVPCYHSVFGKKMSSNEDRLMMCELATNDLENIKTSNIEIDHKITGGTIYCVEKLLKLYPENQFYWIIGQDNANCFEKWHRYQELRELIPFIVVSRPGHFEQKDHWYQTPPHLTCRLDMPISSTQVRESISGKKSIENLVLPVVSEYIKIHGLYNGERNEDS